MRYFKATIICGFLAVLAGLVLFELGAFRGADAFLASFLGQPSPPIVGRGWQAVLVVALSFGVAWTTIDVSRTSLKVAVFGAVLAEIATAVWVFDLFENYFSPFASLTAVGVAFLLSFIYSQTPPGRRKRVLYELLGDRVSARTFHSLLNCDVPVKFDGEIREATVVVCEIFNHEHLGETMRVNDYVAMTNAFLRNSADFLVEHGGYLDECDGESLRVVFGAPLPDSAHAAHAAAAALALAARLDEVNRECQQVWQQMFDYRIGINSGEMVIAAYGSGRLGTFSVAGEPVEFARRLCAANTIYGSRILIGAGTFNAAENAVEVRPMEMIQRFGSATQREEIYELLGLREQLAGHVQHRRDHFWKGIVLYREQLWDAALTEFRAACEVDGGDGPSEFYIRRIEQLRAGAPPLDWSTGRL